MNKGNLSTPAARSGRDSVVMLGETAVQRLSASDCLYFRAVFWVNESELVEDS